MDEPVNPGKLRSSTDLDPEEARYYEAIRNADRTMGTANIQLRPSELITIMAECQLALRCPGHPPTAAKVVRDILSLWEDALRERDPILGELIERGWNENEPRSFLVGEEEHSRQEDAMIGEDGAIAAASVNEMLDTSSWEEKIGTGSVGVPLCPWCGIEQSKFELAPDGFGVCHGCEQRFAWSAGRTPAGFSYTTWRYQEQH